MSHQKISTRCCEKWLTLRTAFWLIMLSHVFWWGCHAAVILTSLCIVMIVWSGTAWLSWCALSFRRVWWCVSRNSWLFLLLAMCSKSFVCLSDFAWESLIWKKLSSFAFTVSFLVRLGGYPAWAPNVSLSCRHLCCIDWRCRGEHQHRRR